MVLWEPDLVQGTCPTGTSLSSHGLHLQAASAVLGEMGWKPQMLGWWPSLELKNLHALKIKWLKNEDSISCSGDWSSICSMVDVLCFPGKKLLTWGYDGICGVGREPDSSWNVWSMATGSKYSISILHSGMMVPIPSDARPRPHGQHHDGRHGKSYGWHGWWHGSRSQTSQDVSWPERQGVAAFWRQSEDEKFMAPVRSLGRAEYKDPWRTEMVFVASSNSNSSVTSRMAWWKSTLASPPTNLDFPYWDWICKRG